MTIEVLTEREREEADLRAGRAVNFACSHVRDALQTKIASFDEQSWSLKLLQDGAGSVLVCESCDGLSASELLRFCPEHKKAMRFPTSLRLAGGTVIDGLYFCPVEGCHWRYSNNFGYKRATEF